MNGKKTTEPTIHQLKVTLDDVKPPIWRRIQVQSEMPLDAFHAILQIVMGWEDSHLHMFRVGNVIYAPASPDFELELGEKDEAEVVLSQIVPKEGMKFSYQYDFGDSWDHTILVEKILPYTEDEQLPRVLDGKRACPPEDCGGVWGYADLLEALADPKNPEHADRLEWLGDDFDPEEFEADEINEALGFELGAGGLLTDEQIEMLIDLSLADIKQWTIGVEHVPGSGSFVLKLDGRANTFAAVSQIILTQFGDLVDVKFVIELGPGKEDPLILRASGNAKEIDDLWDLLGSD